ncbi:MAG: hypothetical protein E6K76_05370 [Candidatus Eisenbacteria bacterium]|uniref:Uncharacterized protein n=1 Tax=Eiseniibacteriota bacterium TaxID=2212470 RepID=A0A538T6L5_UNCEI|nr:MAG: hypothetical protein E6K76_05370 [Candidatus Eisenbacteria bacterium]
MKRLEMFLIVSALAIGSSGCTNQNPRRLTDPASSPEPRLSEFREARWIAGENEIREATTRAAKSPLMVRAIADRASDPGLELLRTGIVGALGTMADGRRVRITILPYQYRDDLTRAVYFALLEVSSKAQVQSFELIRRRDPSLLEAGFQPVNSGEHNLWLKEGALYALSAAGTAVRAPERFNWARFGVCFIPLADMLLRRVDDACNSMGNFPGCVTVGSGAAILGAALYCAIQAFRG